MSAQSGNADVWRRPLRKRCAYCGRYFVPDRRVGIRQKACNSLKCRRKRKQEAQKHWLDNNPGYFKGRYDDVKEWRRRKKAGKMIQDEIPRSKAMQKYVLLIPEAKTGVIQDEIILRRLNGITFAAYGWWYKTRWTKGGGWFRSNLEALVRAKS